MNAALKFVNHEQAAQLLHNKFIVVLGDSIQRSVYKDLVLLLQKDRFLTSKQLKSKGEMSFEQDCLVEGGCLSQMHNGTNYREVRQFQSDHHLVRFYFVTCVYSHYMQSILEDFRRGLKPDVLIVNSCVWDISRYWSTSMDDYKDNLQMFFTELKGILPEESLVIWNLTMPLGDRIKGGFLVPEIEHKAPQLRYDVIEANFYSATLANSYGMDVLDLHFQFRYSLNHRTKDGVHWNALAHRNITSLLLQHSAQAWGVALPWPLTTVERQPSSGNYDGHSKELIRASLPLDHFHSQQPQRYSDQAVQAHRPRLTGPGLQAQAQAHRPRLTGPGSQAQAYRPRITGPGLLAQAYRPICSPWHHPPDYRCEHSEVRHDPFYRPPHFRESYEDHHHHNVMRRSHSRHRYAPHAHVRPSRYGHLDY